MGPVRVKPSHPAPIFLSFVSHDAKYARELEDHLAMFVRIGVAELVSRSTRAPEDEPGALESKLDAAWVIVVLASARYLASAEHIDVHCARALQRHASGQAKIIPVRLRSCDLQNSPLAHLASIPRGERPIVSLRHRESTWIEVLTAIRGAIDDLHETRLYTAPPAHAGADVTPFPLPDMTPLPIPTEASSRLHPPTRLFTHTPITDLVQRKIAELQPTNLVAFDQFRDAARLSIEAERDPGEEGARVKRRAAGRELLDCIENTLYVRFDRVRMAAKSAPAWTEGLASSEAGRALLEHFQGDRYPSLEKLDEWLEGSERLPSGAAAALRRALGIPKGLGGELKKAARLRADIAATRPISVSNVAYLEWVAGSLINRRLPGPLADTAFPRVDEER